MVKVIAVSSGKGGSGKSTCSVELALAFLKLGEKVLLIDADVGMRCLDMLLGVTESLVFDLSDLLLGKELNDCLLTPKKHPNLRLLSAPSKQGDINVTAFGEFIKSVSEEDFDTVIIDFPAGSNKALFEVLPKTSEFICICNPNPVSVRDAANIGSLLAELNLQGRLVINRFEPFYVPNPVFSDLDDIINETGLTLLGIVPESEKLRFAFLDGSFPTRGREFKAFLRIAERIDGKNVKLPKLKRI